MLGGFYRHRQGRVGPGNHHRPAVPQKQPRLRARTPVQRPHVEAVGERPARYGQSHILGVGHHLRPLLPEQRGGGGVRIAHQYPAVESAVGIQPPLDQGRVEPRHVLGRAQPRRAVGVALGHAGRVVQAVAVADLGGPGEIGGESLVQVRPAGVEGEPVEKVLPLQAVGLPHLGPVPAGAAVQHRGRRVLALDLAIGDFQQVDVARPVAVIIVLVGLIPNLPGLHQRQGVLRGHRLRLQSRGGRPLHALGGQVGADPGDVPAPAGGAVGGPGGVVGPRAVAPVGRRHGRPPRRVAQDGDELHAVLLAQSRDRLRLGQVHRVGGGHGAHPVDIPPRQPAAGLGQRRPLVGIIRADAPGEGAILPRLVVRPGDDAERVVLRLPVAETEMQIVEAQRPAGGEGHQLRDVFPHLQGPRPPRLAVVIAHAHGPARDRPGRLHG